MALNPMRVVTQEMLTGVVELFEAEQGVVLGERVYRALRKSILDGDIPSETWIKETDLTAALGISRSPLREALVRLAGDELVVAAPNRGVVVRGVGPKELLAIYEVLSSLESFAAELAAERATESQITQMRHEIELSEFFLDRDRLDDAIQQGIKFHAILYASTHNAELAKLINALRERTHAFRRFGIRSQEHLRRGMHHHLAVIDAIERRDGQRAAQLMREHIGSSLKLLERNRNAGADGQDPIADVTTDTEVVDAETVKLGY
jgi:DNA-binding GntR family transcriptional regulator